MYEPEESLECPGEAAAAFTAGGGPFTYKSKGKGKGKGKSKLHDEK